MITNERPNKPNGKDTTAIIPSHAMKRDFVIMVLERMKRDGKVGDIDYDLDSYIDENDNRVVEVTFRIKAKNNNGE